MANKKPTAVFQVLGSYLLPALVICFGLQLLRNLIPALVWYLRDTLGAGTMDLIPYAFGTFFLGFLAPLLRRLPGSKSALWVTAGGVAAIRVASQISSSPGLDFWLAIAGVGLFLNFLSLYLGHTRQLGGNASRRWAYGLVLGFALDTALRGVFGARDLKTVAGVLPLLLIVMLAVAIIWALWRESPPSRDSKSDSRSGLLLAIGPFFALQLLYLQSQGWIEVLTGIRYPAGFLIVMLGYVAAAAGLYLGFAHPRRFHPLLAALLAVYLTYAVFAADQSGLLSLFLIVAGQFFLGWGLSAVATLNSSGGKAGLWRTTLACNGGMLLFLALTFAFYVGLDLPLPLPRQVFPALLAAIFGVVIIIASVRVRRQEDSAWDPAGLAGASLLVLVPVFFWILLGKAPQPAQPGGYPVKIMTYNIHSAFNAAGSQDLEGIAAVIEASGADIIGLQEVSRVRLMDGAADMPTWLSRRLGMYVLFQGSEEPTWGNALLSRYPILESGWGELPRAGSLIGRIYLWARVDVGEDEPLLVIVTHLHHLKEDSQIRQVQMPVLLEFWDGQSPAVLLGDFNAWPGEPEMDLLAKAGLVDSWGEAGSGPGYTWPTADPYQRIDWIWHTLDLQVLEAEAIQAGASDHLPVLVEISQ